MNIKYITFDFFNNDDCFKFKRKLISCVKRKKHNYLKNCLKDCPEDLSSSIKIKGKVRVILEDFATGIVVNDTGWVDNVVPTIGRIALAKVMAGVATASNHGQITYCAVGTGTTTPNITGTKLTTEIDRVAISASSTNVDNEVQIRAFFTTSEGNGTLKELGLFGEDATLAVDSGTMFQWISFDVEKTSGETMTVLSKIPINYE